MITTDDTQLPKMDRIKHFDERSRAYGIRPLIAGVPERKKKLWTPGPLLDQGSEGACVGFGASAELGCTPVRVPVDNTFAYSMYQEARGEDAKMANVYDDGASVLAGAKAAKALGFISEYRWCFGIDDVIHALLTAGPVVLGIDWYDGMYYTGDDGLVSVYGAVVGGHCICAFGFIPAEHPSNHFGADVVAWRNSWGTNYGVVDPHTGLRNGVGYIKTSDLSSLLKAGGEAVVFRDNRKAAK